MIAARPENESSRVANLREYQILDTDPDPAFDDLVKTASAVAEMPISLINLVDEHRAWFKAKRGIEIDGTSRDLSFCSHAILADAPTIVEDTTSDVRFSDHPLVIRAPNIRFYAGFPLVSKEGYVLGALCVIDRVPRKLTTKQIEVLQLLAKLAVSLIERNHFKCSLEQTKLKLG